MATLRLEVMSRIVLYPTNMCWVEIMNLHFNEQQWASCVPVCATLCPSVVRQIIFPLILEAIWSENLRRGYRTQWKAYECVCVYVSLHEGREVGGQRTFFQLKCGWPWEIAGRSTAINHGRRLSSFLSACERKCTHCLWHWLVLLFQSCERSLLWTS